MARRININTGNPYKMGDEPTKLDLPLREGLVFSRYGDRKYKKTDATKGYREGYFHERWISHDAYEALKKKASSRSLEHQRRHRGKGKKQVNPSTGEPWKTGELNSKGQYFWKHSGYVRNDGYFSLLWADNHKEYLRKRIQAIQTNKPKFCRENGLDINITGTEGLEYLISIFPENYICPALGIKMQWNNKSHVGNSPSLDRIKPELGYVKGNLAWISERANTMKHNANSEELLKIGMWLQKEESK
jgi:hypothetical protein